MRYLFVLLQYGSHGSPKDFDFIRSALKHHAAAKEASATHLTIFETPVNQVLASDDGTILCAKRLIAELQPAVEKWLLDHNSGNGTDELCFSCIGHSFGGIILREAVCLLLKDCPPVAAAVASGVLKFESFVTVATPHCGVEFAMNAVSRFIGKTIGKVYSLTYADLLLDSDVLTERLLDADHIRALQQFSRRVLFANVHKDWLISFETASLCLFDKDDGDVGSGGGARHQVGCDWDAKMQLKRVMSELASGGGNLLHVQPSFTVGSHRPFACCPANSSAATSRAAAIAMKLRRSCQWEVVPVRTRSVLPIAHNTIVRGISVFADPMMDVINAVSDAVLLPPSAAPPPPPCCVELE